MKQSLSQRPIVAVALAFATGCVVSMLSDSTPFSGLAVAALGCAGALWAFWRGQRGWSVLLIGVALLGFARASVQQSPGRWDVSRFAGRRTPVILDGYIASDPQVTPERIRFIFNVTAASAGGHDVPATGRVSVSVRRNALDASRAGMGGLEYGRSLRTRAHLSRPQGPRNPGEFSWAAYLARRGVFASVWIDNPADLTVFDEAAGPTLAVWAYRVRALLQKTLMRRLPEREAALASGMVLGSYSLVPEDLVNSFTRTGTLHLLAASGYNCALIVTIFWRMLLKRSRAPRALSAASVILLIVFYVLMAGAGPSIVRAGVGASLFMTALLLGRPVDMLSILAGTAAIMLAVDPLSIAGAGFQLSFAAVASIIAFAPQLESLSARFIPDAPDGRKPPLSRRIAVHLRDVAIVTTAATVATAPLIANYFNRVSLVSLPANLAVAALAEWLFVATVALSVLSWAPLIGWLLAKMVFALAVAVEAVVGFMGSAAFAEINVRSPGVAGLTIWFALMTVIWWRWKAPASPVTPCSSLAPSVPSSGAKA